MKIGPLVVHTPVSWLLFCCLQLYFIHLYALVTSESLNRALDQSISSADPPALGRGTRWRG